MVDFLSSTSPKEACPGPGTTTPDATGTGTEGRHLRHLMGRTQGLLKSRLKSVLAGSNGLLTGLSTRLESALSLSTDTLSDSTDDDDGITDDATTEATTDAATPTPAPAPTEPAVSRGASEIFSKKLRLPRLKHALSFEDYTTLARHKKKKERAQAAVVEHAQSKGRDDQSLSSGDTTNDCGRELSPVQPQHIELQATGPDPYDKLHYKTEAPSSGSASDIDGYGPSTSIDTDQDGKKYWVRSGSEGSVQSWASSLSYESQSDEITVEAVEFMRKFVHDLFQDSSAIPLDQKSKFGQLAQHEAGRLWFSRFVNAQRVHHKKVDESTFYSLVQYFAIVLFECADADDFSPAKSLMNMCFTFYHEIDVPGCEPYKEYLYTYLREQTIWHSLRFWNAAFFDALQCERVHRPVVTRDDIQSNRLEAITDEKQYQENITFGQLGTFTYNMHAFGLSRELCSEFLRKQCIIANLSEEQEKMLRDNVERMYRETELWR